MNSSNMIGKGELDLKIQQTRPLNFKSLKNQKKSATTSTNLCV
jgi:hypothetical protein